MICFVCDHCGQPFERQSVAQVRCLRLFCSQRCAGLAKTKRLHRSKAQRIAEKATYDKTYRALNLERIRQRKRDYWQRTYDPRKARIERRKTAKQHAAYIKKYYANPVNKAAKVAYDLDRRAAVFGPFAEAYKLLRLLRQEVHARIPSPYERLRATGYYDRQPPRRQHAA